MSEKYIGIRFAFPQNYENHLALLFENVAIADYTWYVSCSENYMSNGEKTAFYLPDGIYSGRDFAEIIQFPEYYIHLLCLFGVPNGKSFCADEILKYEDFSKSNAQIALLSADSITDLYIKDQRILKIVAASCRMHYQSTNTATGHAPELFSRATDDRTMFLV